jgi:hypothetical protein
MRMRWIRIDHPLAVAAVCLASCGDAAGGENTSATAGDTETPPTTSASTTADPPTGDPATSMSSEVDASGVTTDDPTDATGEAESSGTTGLPDDVEVIELRAGGFQPPLQETFYSCFSFTFAVDELHHIIGFRPVVTSPIIHHYVLSIADGVVDRDPNDSCFEWPASILWAWAPGIDDTMLPDEAGFLIGDAAGGQHTFILQVHYNDPLLTGVTDDDGIDVLVTPTLRPNAAGIISQGDIATISIPPGQAAYPHVATCPEFVTQGLLDQPIHVFSSFLHAHEIGSAITTELFRNDASVGIVAMQDPFDFNTQVFQPADIDIMPGDRIETTCVYDSTGRTSPTPGGVASDEEMCINFLMYYPQVAGEKCGSI